jgi:CDP-diacylglycerol--serine O-phosphatidyltransferase
MAEAELRGRRRRRGRRRAERRRAIYLLPNLVTSAALLLGYGAIIESIRENYEQAALFIVLAGIADMLDGRIARATNAVSPFGVQYDSLADLISFGLAPSVLMYTWVLEPLGRRGWLLAALFALCAALRLARFNVKAAHGDSDWYQGVPSTFAGGMIAATVWFVTWIGYVPPFDRPVGTLLTLFGAALALLMVSTVPYPSLKMIRVEGRRTFWLLFAIVLLAIALVLNHEWMFFALGLGFIASGPLIWLYRRATHSPAPAFPAPDEPHPDAPGTGSGRAE